MAESRQLFLYNQTIAINTTPQSIIDKKGGYHGEYSNKEYERPLFLQARQCYASKKWKDVKYLYTKLLKVNPTNAYYHNSYASILTHSVQPGQYKCYRNAMKHCNTALQIQPDLASARQMKIECLRHLFRYEEIQNEFSVLFKQSLNIDYTYPVERFLMFSGYSQYLFDISRLQDSIKYLQHALNFEHCIYPVKIRHDLSHLYCVNDQLSEALKILKGAKLYTRTDHEIFDIYTLNDDNRYYGHIYIKMQAYKKAYKYLKKSYQVYKNANLLNLDICTIVYLIECCAELKKFREAEKFYAEAMKLIARDPTIVNNPMNKDILNILTIRKCIINIKQGGKRNLMTAISILRRIQQNEFQNGAGNDISNFHFYLGIAYKKLNKIIEAKKMFFISIHLKLKYTLNYWEFGKILMEEKEFFLSRKYLNISFQRSPEIKCIAKYYPIFKTEILEQIMNLKCNYCKKTNLLIGNKKHSKLKVCKGCQKIFYCSRLCQKLDWRKSHKYSCSLFWRKVKKIKLKKPILSEDFTTFKHLQSTYSVYFNSFT